MIVSVCPEIKVPFCGLANGFGGFRVFVLEENYYRCEGHVQQMHGAECREREEIASLSSCSVTEAASGCWGDRQHSPRSRRGVAFRAQGSCGYLCGAEERAWPFLQLLVLFAPGTERSLLADCLCCTSSSAAPSESQPGFSAWLSLPCPSPLVFTSSA